MSHQSNSKVLKISPMSPEGLVSFQPQEVRRIGIVKSPSFLVAGCLEHNAKATRSGETGLFVPLKKWVLL